MFELRSRKVCFLLLVFSVLCPIPGQAETSSIARAEAAFDNLSVEGKATIQVMMTAAGYWAQIPRSGLSRRLFEDFQRFQADLGHPTTGYLTASEVDSLFQRAVPNLRYWGFVELPHPTRGRPIWVPKGIGGTISASKFGVEFVGKGVTITYNYFQDTMLEAAFRYILDKLFHENQDIRYRVLRNEFFAISTIKEGISKYYRYHRDGTGLLGFTMVWENNEAPIYGERVATLVSSSLSNQMLGTPMIPVPTFISPRVANAPPAALSPQALPAQQTPPGPTPKGNIGFSSGSGFFVNGGGKLITNNHVIEGCSTIRVFAGSSSVSEARVLARDRVNDLALLATSLRPQQAAALRSSLRLGEAVAAFGFPHADILASSGNFTLGNVTALAGTGDDSRYVQISTPVQAGNSGGPLLDQNGNLVGVVTSTLNAIKIMQASGDLPQNVNFALKASVLQTFLEANGVEFSSGATTSALKPEDLADQAKSISAFISCK